MLDSVTEERGQESSEREWKDTQQRGSCWTQTRAAASLSSILYVYFSV